MRSAIRHLLAGPHMRAFVLALLTAVVCTSARADHGIAADTLSSPPLLVKLFLKDAAGSRPIFGPSDAIILILQVETTEPLVTTEGFGDDEFRSYLTVSTEDGARHAPTAAGLFHSHPNARIFSCHRGTGRGPGRPVVKAEVLPGPSDPDHFVFEYEFKDLRELVELGNGVHVAEVRIPLIAFPAVLDDCNQLTGDMADLRSGVPVTVASNGVAFVIADSSFGGFASPLVNDDECARIPCNTFNRGRTVPVKFKLFDADGVPIKSATVRMAVTQVSGKSPLQPFTELGTFRFDNGLGNYVFNWDTTGFARGTWRIDALFEDGTIRSVHVALK